MPYQMDHVKETRIQISRVCEATDREVIEAALAFARWAEYLKINDSLTPTDHYTSVSSV